MIILSYYTVNGYVLDGFKRNTMASYQENLESVRKEAKI